MYLNMQTFLFSSLVFNCFLANRRKQKSCRKEQTTWMAYCKWLSNGSMEEAYRALLPLFWNWRFWTYFLQYLSYFIEITPQDKPTLDNVLSNMYLIEVNARKLNYRLYCLVSVSDLPNFRHYRASDPSSWSPHLDNMLYIWTACIDFILIFEGKSALIQFSSMIWHFSFCLECKRYFYLDKTLVSVVSRDLHISRKEAKRNVQGSKTTNRGTFNIS